MGASMARLRGDALRCSLSLRERVGVREAAGAYAGFWSSLDEDAAALLGLSLTPALSREGEGEGTTAYCP